MSSRFKSPLSFFWQGFWRWGVGEAENFIRLRVESFSLQRQQGGKNGISQSLYNRKVVKGRLCMGTRGSSLRLHSATRGLWETARCSEPSLAISAGNCGSAGEVQGDRNRRCRGAGGAQGGHLASLIPSRGLVLSNEFTFIRFPLGSPAGQFNFLGVCLST